MRIYVFWKNRRIVKKVEERSSFAKLKVEIYKPITDTRYDNTKVVSHNENFVNSTIVKDSSEIFEKIDNPDVVGIDEFQFFTDDLKYNM